MKSLLKMLKSAFLVSIVLLVICGFAYPVLVTGASQLLFPKQANGNLVTVDGEAVGSQLVGQDFTDDRYFKGRVSSVNYNTYTEGDESYGGVSSGSTNYAATNPELKERVEKDMAEFLEKNPDIKPEEIPTDLLTGSGSGLDPHISPESAAIQIPAIAKATGLTEEELQTMVNNNTEGKFLGVFGENKVNVLMTNLDVAKAIGVIGE